jgi:hypothetical protein
MKHIILAMTVSVADVSFQVTHLPVTILKNSGSYWQDITGIQNLKESYWL